MKSGFTIGSLGIRSDALMTESDDTETRSAHILRRLGFAARADEIATARERDPHELVDDLLDRPGWSLEESDTDARVFGDDDYETLGREWLDRLLMPEVGAHERLVWFWHDHFTTHFEETSTMLMWRQHQRVRRHALGNFRTLAREMVTDGAMLHYLDGSGSRGDSPNENFSREFLELFMLGRNADYAEDDIRAGARILAGWWADWDTGEVRWAAEDAYSRPVTFLGRRRRWTIDEYVDAVLEMPSCAEHVAARLHEYFVTTPLSEDRRRRLGRILRGADWELRPLLEEILHHGDFVNARGRRTRQPVEWLVAAAAVYGFESLEEFDFEFWELWATGQIPFAPPNVAGWPEDDRWSSASQVMSRLGTVLDWELSDELLDSVEPTPVAVLHHCGIPEASPTTREALERAIGSQGEFDRGLDLMLALAVVSPEFVTC